MLIILLLANLLNVFDRTVPAILVESIREEWSLNDAQIGIMVTAFTVVYALAGVPLGRMADSCSRKSIMGWGLVAWSLFTAAGAGAWSFAAFAVTRIGVGIGEASYAPAANSLIGDLFPAKKRSLALGIFMLGLPLGLLLAFFTVGSMVRAFEFWRAPFLLAAVPGLVVAVLLFRIREPGREETERGKRVEKSATQSIRKVISVPTMRWIILAGIGANFSSYATTAFMVPLMQRFFALPLEQAAVSTGIIVGATGLVGLTAGGWLADRVGFYPDITDGSKRAATF